MFFRKHHIRVPRKRSPKFVIFFLLLILLLLPIAYVLITKPEPSQAASMTVFDSPTSITINVPNKYRAVIQKGDTDDYIQFFDRVQSDGTPNATHEFKGPCITETSVYCLRDDEFRTTVILEQTSMRTRIRVHGKLALETSTGYLAGEDTVYDFVVTEDYTFTAEGVFVQNNINYSVGAGIGLNADSAHNGYEWLGVSTDITDEAFSEAATPDIIYGDGHTETNGSNQSDGAEFANTNTYVVMPGAGSDTYQDAFVGIPKPGWYDDANAAGVHEWHWDEGFSGTEDQLTAQEQNYTSIRNHQARWYFLLKNEDDLDTEAEREGLANVYRNPDSLNYTVGSDRYEDPVESGGVYLDGVNDAVLIGDLSTYNFGDTDDFTIELWFKRYGGDGGNAYVCKQNDGASDSGYNLRRSPLINLGAAELTIDDGTDTYTLTGTTVAQNALWYHVAVVFDQDSAANSTLYLNGVDDAPTKTGTIGDIGALGSIGSTALAFGLCDPGSGNNSDLQGVVDEVRIWNTVRTASQIAQNMHEEIDPTSTGLIGYWRLNENGGTTVEDLTSSNADGSFQNDGTWTIGRVPQQYNNAEAAYTLETTSKTAQFDIDAGANVSNSLNGVHADGVTTVTVNSTTGFASSGSAYIDGDKFTYTSTTSTTFTGVPSTGENAVINHASGSVVSSFNRTKPTFKVAGFKGTGPPGSGGLESATLVKGVDFDAQVKPITEASFQQDISFYAPFTSTTTDVGTTPLTNGGCSFSILGIGAGSAILCTADNHDFSFTTTTDDIDYAKGAIEFTMAPASVHTDGVERTFFNIISGSDQFRFRKTSGNTLEFLINDGATAYTESVTSGNYTWDLGDIVHFRLEWDDATGADQMKIFMNGVELTHTDSSGDYDGSLVSPGTTFVLGNSTTTGTVECFCLIDEFYIFDYNGTGTQAGRNRVGMGGGNDALSTDTFNQTLSFAPVDANGRGEYLYLGFDTKVNGVNFDLATNGVSGGTPNLDWEYWNGSSWTSLESVTGFTDTTRNLTQSGSVYWTGPPPGWKDNRMSNRFDLFYIRASMNNSSGTFTTSPIESKVTTDILEFQYLSTLTTEDQSFVLPTQVQPSVFWKMDEGQGTAINDSTGNRNDGTRLNAVWQTEDMCVSGKCLYFDGSGSPRDYLYRQNDDSFNFTASESFSMGVWIKREPISTDPNVILAKYNSTTGGYKIRMENDGDISCGIDDDSSYTPDAEAVSTLASYDDNQWHHIECVKNGTSSLSLYIDGILITTNSSISGVGSLVNTDPFYLGNGGDGLSDAFKGFMDEMKIYPYARTAAEVKSDAIAGASSRGSTAVLGAQDTAFLNDGLAGYWKLNESSGNATDSSGNNTTLTNNSTTPYTGAKFGLGSEHDGSTDYFEAADTTTLSLTGDVTLAAWINNDDTSGSQNIIGKWDGTNNSYLLALEGDELRMYIDSASNYQTTTAANLSSNTFTHVAGVYSASSQTVKLFVNGVEQTSSTTGTIPASIGDDAGELVIGADDSPANYFDGHIDEARIYNRSLSPSEIQKLYNWAPGPVGHWKLDENTGSSISDSTGNTGDGGLSGNTAFRPAKYGSGARFDGKDTVSMSFIDMPTNTLEDQTQGTICTWAKPYDTGDTIQNMISIAEDDGGTHSDLVLLGYERTTDSFLLSITNNGASVLFGGTADNVVTNQWNHFCVTMDTSGNKFYVNGNQKIGGYTTGNAATDFWIDDIDENTTNLTFGCLDSGSTANSCSATTQMYEGELDDVRIYNYARSPAQIVEDMNAGHPLGGSPVGSQIMSWKFDEQSTETANNAGSAGSGYNATRGGSASTAEADDPTWKTITNCKINGCLSFDGGDYLSIGTSSALQIDSKSISFWANPSSSISGTAPVLSLSGANWYVGFTSSNRMLTSHSVTAGTQQTTASSSDAYVPDQWSHFTYTFSVVGSNVTIKMYVNGKLVTTTNYATGYSGTYSASAVLGAFNSTTLFFTGSVDEVKVYNSALTDEQIKIDMNANASINLSTGANEEVQSAAGSATAPVAYWDLNENTSTSAFDKSGSGYTGTLTNTPLWIQGKYGAGVDFNGNSSNQYITVSDADALSPVTTGEYTVEAWFKQSTDTVDRDWIVAKGNTSNYEFGVAVYNGTMYCEIWDSSGSSIAQINAGSVSTGAWHFVACTMDDALGMELYLDGVSVGTSGGVTGGMSNTTSALQIGNRADGGDNNFDGIIDDVKIYNYVRSSAQLLYDYNQGSPTGRWKLDECTGATVYNSAQNANGDAAGNNGTVTIGASGSNTSAGSCGTVNTATSWYNGATGKFNGSLDLDGTDDYVSVADTSTLRFDSATQDFSIFAWVKRTTTGTEYILSKEDADNDGWRLLFTSGNTVQCSQDSTDVTSTTTITDTNWHLVGCTIDRDGNGQVYIDGSANGSAVAMGSDAMATTSNITFGTRSYTSTSYLNGQIDDVQIFPYAISDTQVKILLNEGSGARFGPQTGSP